MPEWPEDLDKQYDNLLPTLRALKEEAAFIVDQVVAAEGIKLHSFTHRVKDRASAMEKFRRKDSELGGLRELPDLVGLRIVTLFVSDLPRIAALLKDQFVVMAEDDTIEARGSEDGFGYMSLHLVVRMKEEYAGPRYDLVKDFPVEVQVRTILMDAWANVSHYLDYKGESSIPEHLRRDFFALSGLFYVADKQL